MDFQCQISPLSIASSTFTVHPLADKTLKVLEVPKDKITVGTEFELLCEGPWQKDIGKDSLHFVKDAQTKYAIELLGFEFQNSTIAKIKVTSYQVGSVHFDNLVLTDGKQNFSLGKIQFEVVSVRGDSEVQTLFGSVAPVLAPLPWIYVAGFFGAILFVLGTIAIKIFYRSQRRALERELAQHDSAQSPIQQVHSHLRKMKREQVLFLGADVDIALIQSALIEIQSSLHLFLTREFRIPVSRWSERKVFRSLKDEHPKLWADFADEFSHIFSELRQALVHYQKLNSKDVIQIAEEVRRFIEKIDKRKNQIEGERS